MACLCSLFLCHFFLKEWQTSSDRSPDLQEFQYETRVASQLEQFKASWQQGFHVFHRCEMGSTISTLLHDKINPKDCQVLSLGDSGFLQFFRVVSSDYGKPQETKSYLSIPSTKHHLGGTEGPLGEPNDECHSRQSREKQGKATVIGKH